jgi:ketosteroid isomerase-like protein
MAGLYFALMSAETVLRANAAFYDAFEARDFTAMDGVWARTIAVTCIHPGWNRLMGRENVMKSWRAILSNPASPSIECVGATVHMVGDAAYVLCHERVRGGGPALIATNVFIREGEGWCLAHHQAGPVSVDEEAESQEDPEAGGGLMN